MRGGLLLAAAPLMLATLLAEPVSLPTPVPLQKSISSSQQFIIYHSDRKLRSRVARKVEDIKERWQQMLHLDDEWKAPIIVQLATLQPANAPRVRTSLYESDGGEVKVQIDVYDLTVLQSGDFDFEVYRALCLEYAARETPPKAGKAFPQPPAWLLQGFYEDGVTREGGVPAGLYEKLVEKGANLKLDAFLKEKPERMDAVSLALYRAQAMALLRSLLSTPEGAKHLAEYLSGLFSVNPVDADKLLEKFPTLAAQPSDLAKLWTLSLANASASDRIKPLSMAETQKSLSLFLDLSAARDPKKPEAGMVTGPEALMAVARTDAGRYVMRQKAEDLLRLESRAHPIMRPVITEYRLIVTELIRKPRKNLEKRIRKNHELELAVATRGGEIEDYLNWFEAARMETPSQEFEAAFQHPSESPEIPRTDAISRRLDDMEAAGW